MAGLRRGTLDRMPLASQSLGHHPLRLAGIEIHQQPAPHWQLLEGQPAAHVVERAGGAAQIQMNGGLRR